MNEWILESREAKRLFIMGLAALAARGETGPGEPENCRVMADKFGALSDLVWFMASRTSPEELQALILRMSDEVLIKATQDAVKSGDFYSNLLVQESTKRNLEIPTETVSPSGGTMLKRKFSFDD